MSIRAQSLNRSSNVITLSKVHLYSLSSTPNVVIRNVFNTDNLSPLYRNSNSQISVWNSYSSADFLNNYLVTGEFIYTNDFTNKELMTNTLHYNEFVNEEDLEINEQNVWLYIPGELPILYFDSMNNPKVIIHANSYSWTDLGPSDQSRCRVSGTSGG